jgi:DNA invertase Pin-like site-specific DNA recombinase
VNVGDSLVVTKTCRLARSVADLVAIIERLEKKGLNLRILSMGIDTATPTGRLMLNLLASISQFEREVMLERQREGVAKAKAEGKYKGRKPTARAKSDQILELYRQGLSREGIASQLGIGVASVYRVLKASRVDFRNSRANGKLVPASTPNGWT